jgi:hypothetical protein
MTDLLEPSWVSGCCEARTRADIEGTEVTYRCMKCWKRTGVRLPLREGWRDDLTKERSKKEVTEQIGMFNMEKRK